MYFKDFTCTMSSGKQILQNQIMNCQVTTLQFLNFLTSSCKRLVQMKEKTNKINYYFLSHSEVTKLWRAALKMMMLFPSTYHLHRNNLTFREVKFKRALSLQFWLNLQNLFCSFLTSKIWSDPDIWLTHQSKALIFYFGKKKLF